MHWNVYLLFSVSEVYDQVHLRCQQVTTALKTPSATSPVIILPSVSNFVHWTAVSLVFLSAFGDIWSKICYHGAWKHVLSSMTWSHSTSLKPHLLRQWKESFKSVVHFAFSCIFPIELCSVVNAQMIQVLLGWHYSFMLIVQNSPETSTQKIKCIFFYSLCVCVWKKVRSRKNVVLAFIFSCND